jgi:peptide/nickel transport system substrate-binding protein
VNRVDASPLDDARVRRALSIDADRGTIARKAYLGHADAAAELVPPQSPWATLRKAKPADPQGAATLLDQAGWRAGGDGIRRRDGQRLAFTLTIVAGGRSLQSAATLLQAHWRALGADVSLRPILANQLYAPDGILASGNFRSALIGFGSATTPDRSAILASRSVPPGGLNYARYRNAGVDAAIAAARTSSEAATRHRAFATIAGAVANDAPYAPLAWVRTILAISTKLQGVKPEPVNSDLWNVYAWKLD